ncbi:hypothetical protein C2G38_2183631 [Gigaspora rosea]|uniref:Uncharacterized protein n=1 Tax=Gigaspora rosea TaxID=44941 RepID=A0A397VA05_9GLOM|nr:hypothetical protein C2G38_2183631 [Gigaspora rosea]
MDKLISIFESDYILFMDIKQHVMIACNALQAQFIELYKAIKIYDPKQLPASDNNLANYGNKAINILAIFIE